MTAALGGAECRIRGTMNNWVGYTKNQRGQYCYVAGGTEKNKTSLKIGPVLLEDLTRNLLSATLFKFLKNI
jgi:hypothetical protein